MKTEIQILLIMLALLASLRQTTAQGTAFIYQGQLQNNGSLANGNYDLTFAIFGGSPPVQVSATLTNAAVVVSNGLFTVALDFGAGIFPGAARFLEIGVRTNGNGAGSFTILNPRQQLTPTPYAITAENVVPGAGLSGAYGSAVTLSNSANQFDGAFTGNGASITNVGGGFANESLALDTTVGGGVANTSSGVAATVPGGQGNIAQGNYSFAAGSQAKAQKDGTFVWADTSPHTFDPYALSGPQGLANSFNARATAGFYFVTAVDVSGNITAGVQVPGGGGSWSSLSDRNAKTNFLAVNAHEVLEKLAQIPIETWNYKAQAASIRHIGPMAQDFASAFGVGEDDRHITTVDEEGVALAAIQGLNEKIEVRSQNAEVSIRKLEAENAELRQSVAELKAMMKRLVVQK